MSPAVQVVRTYLELRSPAQLRPARVSDASITFLHRQHISVPDYRRLYREVGERWHWEDRNVWSDDRLAAHLASADVAVWECIVAGESAGYFELQRAADGSVEIAYFGLIERFMGRGIGKAMLTRAAEAAWALRPSRVWLHTCTLDSPRALPNYRARGFEEYHQETFVVQLAETREHSSRT